jgi:hypothetical protein
MLTKAQIAEKLRTKERTLNRAFTRLGLARPWS